MKTAKNEALLALKLARRKSREEEIALFGHPINYRKVFADKTKYNRARDKANRHKGGSPYFLSFLGCPFARNGKNLVTLRCPSQGE